MAMTQCLGGGRHDQRRRHEGWSPIPVPGLAGSAARPPLSLLEAVGRSGAVGRLAAPLGGALAAKGAEKDVGRTSPFDRYTLPSGWSGFSDNM
jgi:hypothetical protein